MDISTSFDPVSSGLSFVSGLANSIGGARQAVKNRRHQNALLEKQQTWSEQMAEKQNQWNIDQWNRQNEYNTPAAQMSRMEAAGINPYNAVNSGQIGSGAAASLQSATPNNVSAPAYAEAYSNPVGNFISGLSSSLDNALKVISVDREKKLTPSIVEQAIQNARGSKGSADMALAEGVKAQNDLVNEPSRVAANANLYQSQFHEFAYNSQYYALKAQGVDDIVANELAQMRSETQIMKLNADGLGYDNITKSVLAKYADESERARIDLMVKQGKLTEEQAKNMEKQNKFFERITFAQLANYAAQTAAAYGSADASHAAAGLSRQQTATERERTSYERKQNDWFTPSYDQRMYRSGKYGENSESYPFLRSMYRAGEFLKSFVPSLFGTPKH